MIELKILDLILFSVFVFLVGLFIGSIR
jgi:hypothetical protein